MIRSCSVFVERKPGFDAEAGDLLHELKSALALEALREVRIITRYEVTGLGTRELDAAAPGLLFEAPSDSLIADPRTALAGLRVLAREYLPGQYDQRADSAARGLRLLHPDHVIDVRCSELFVLEGNLNSDDVAAVQDWIINPVDSRSCDPFGSAIGEAAPEPRPVPVLQRFRHADSNGLAKLRRIHGIALDIEDMEFIRSWFDDREKRDPTLAELKALDTYWSDHCRHTTFETELIEIEVADGPEADEISRALGSWDAARRETGRLDRPRTLMDLATIAGRQARLNGFADDWDISEEINACTLKVKADIDSRSESWLLSFKNETHNHPTEIEPYGGASTCLGGAIRDPLSGRAYVHQALRVTGGADPRQDPAAARPGKLPQRLIAQVAAEGYAGYGNQIGLATAVVREYYHPGYEAKRLECGAVMGASPAANVVREVPAVGDVVILVGGRTGRDGIGGATGSSVAHETGALDRAGAEVQKGNPPEERKLQRLFRNPAASKLVRRCNDFGAGGVAVAVGELAAGLKINLDAVPVKYRGLDGLELALSESQERMAVVVAASDAAAFISFADRENLEAVAIAEVTGDRRLTMMWRGSTIINLSRDFLDTSGVRRWARAVIRASDIVTAPGLRGLAGDAGLTDANLKTALAAIEVSSRKGLEERFDGTVGSGTVLASHGGRRQLTPAEASIHLLPADGIVKTAGIMTVGFDPALAELSPFRGGQYALIESLAKMAAAGGSWRKARFSLQEFFGRTDRGAEAWGRPAAALLGALTVQQEWNLPAIGGKDSMSGSFEELDVPPTLIAFAAGAMDSSAAMGAALPAQGLKLVLAGPAWSARPDFDSLAAGWDFVERLNSGGVLRAAASVGRGGWAVKLAQMAMGSFIGVRITAEPDAPFSAAYGQVLAAVEADESRLTQLAAGTGAEWRILGESLSEPEITWNGGCLPLDDALEAWRSTLAGIWPVDLQSGGSGQPELAPGIGRSPGGDWTKRRPAGTGKAAPRVCIPVFPGTNGEDDARRAFARAGALPAEHVFRDRRADGLDKALGRLAREIEQCQILYISGGFSAGDEPDGAGKYISAILRQSRVADAVAGLLERDGLVLGICNGFQALLKSGWLETGVPGIPSADSPTLARNRVGRHISRVVSTVSTGSDSPWLSKIRRGDVHSIPVSHGEGRFTAPTAVLEQLVARGRIPFQYCDPAGRPSLDGEWNPNGSDMAVEALLSPCGRILGKMGHSERWRQGTLIDIPGMEHEQPLIPGGVDWFLQ